MGKKLEPGSLSGMTGHRTERNYWVGNTLFPMSTEIAADSPRVLGHVADGQTFLFFYVLVLYDLAVLN